MIRNLLSALGAIVLLLLIAAFFVGWMVPRQERTPQRIFVQSVIPDEPLTASPGTNTPRMQNALYSSQTTTKLPALRDGAAPVKKTSPTTTCTCAICGSTNCICAGDKCSCPDCGAKDMPCSCAGNSANIRPTQNGVQVCPDGCKCKCAGGDCNCAQAGQCGDPNCQCGYGVPVTALRSSTLPYQPTSFKSCYEYAQRTHKPLILWIGETCIPCEKKMDSFVHARLASYESIDGTTYTGPGVVIGKPNSSGGFDRVATLDGMPTVERIEDAVFSSATRSVTQAAPAQLPIFQPAPMMMPMMGGFGGGFGGGMMGGFGGGGGC